METNMVNQAAENTAASAYAETKKTGKVTGKTVGEPKLSEKAAKYYEQLKKKYGNMDFILVSKDKKAEAEANASKFASSNKTVVLIDEEKIERMAEDMEYRKKYEGIISGAQTQLKQMMQSMGTNSAVKGYGIKINDGGTASFFAVVDKSLAAQKERIDKKAAQKAEDKKKAAKEEREERLEKRRTENGKQPEKTDDKDLVTVTASSIDDLMKQINDVVYTGLSDKAQTEEEKQIGQNFDFSI